MAETLTPRMKGQFKQSAQKRSYKRRFYSSEAWRAYMKAYGKAYRAKNAVKLRADAKLRRERYKGRIRESCRRYRRKNPAKMKQFAIKYKYKLTMEEYRALGSMCHICGVETFEGRHGSLTRHIDHDHATGTIRGILCTVCNHGLGHFKDDIAVLGKAIEYLTRWSAKKSA